MVAVFCYKQIDSLPSVSELFKKKRLELELSFEHVFHRCSISPTYLQALEEHTFEKLPQSKTYRLAYVRAYAEALGLPIERCVHQFISEGGLDNIKFIHPHKQMKLLPFKSWSLVIRNSAIALIIIFFLGYLIWQIKTIITPPVLTIFSPHDGFITKETSVTVEGQTEPATHLTVNGQEVSTNNRGQFSLKFDLVSGLNTLTIASNKKHGKTTIKTFSIIMRPDIIPTFNSPTTSSP